MATQRTYRSIPGEARHVYDNPETVKRYSNRFLWPVEEHLCNTYVRAPGRLLDIGCAAGRMSVPLGRQSGFQVVGLDISFNQVKEALVAALESDARCSFFQCDMRALGLADGSMDYVFITYTSIGALTRPKDRERCVQEVMRVLKPKGIAFISVWNRLWPGAFGSSWAKWTALWLMRLLRLNAHGPGNRVCWEAGGYVLWHYFSFPEAASLFRKAGLDILGMIPFAGAWAENRLSENSWWSRYFGEGLYFVLSKPDRRHGAPEIDGLLRNTAASIRAE
ncbi:MAG TPA: methyltransferase domain-containing protein [Syntrophorhabdaceae bacterium]